jgi:hypothetical protein
VGCIPNPCAAGSIPAGGTKENSYNIKGLGIVRPLFLCLKNLSIFVVFSPFLPFLWQKYGRNFLNSIPKNLSTIPVNVTLLSIQLMPP